MTMISINKFLEWPLQNRFTGSFLAIWCKTRTTYLHFTKKAGTTWPRPLGSESKVRSFCPTTTKTMSCSTLSTIWFPPGTRRKSSLTSNHNFWIEPSFQLLLFFILMCFNNLFSDILFSIISIFSYFPFLFPFSKFDD